MRMSANSIKRKGKGIQPQQRPTPGTNLGIAYDRAMTGDWFNWDGLCKSSNHGLKLQLEGYNLEFVSKHDPESGHGNKRLFKCVGIWVGADLQTLDHVREAIENSVLRDNKAAM